MKKIKSLSIVSFALSGILLALPVAGVRASELYVGAGTVSITPEPPGVSFVLAGRSRPYFTTRVRNPIMATAVALESRQGDDVQGQAIMISCDLLGINGGLWERVRERIAPRLPDFDVKKLFLNATHAHTTPALEDSQYVIPKESLQAAEYVDFVAKRIGDLTVKAWESRRPGGVGWGLGHAVVAHNRRAVYANGSVKMYGKTGGDNFRRIEGREDHGVEVLFFWDENKKLIAAAVNVACPAQESEGDKAINADYWHDVRLKLREKYGKDLCVLCWGGAGGDQSPHLLWRKQAEERMRIKRGLTRTEEIARRIVSAVDDAYEVAKSDIRYDALLMHVVEDAKLPARMVTEEEYAWKKVKYDDLLKKNDSNLSVFLSWYKKVLDRYESQKPNQLYDMELHVIRLGDVAITTNPFELFTDYGIQMKARSKALQTFVIQLVGTGTYLPTAEAVRGGGYSATVKSNLVGPEGGQVLVDRTVEVINKLWPDEKK